MIETEAKVGKRSLTKASSKYVKTLFLIFQELWNLTRPNKSEGKLKNSFHKCVRTLGDFQVITLIQAQIVGSQITACVCIY